HFQGPLPQVMGFFGIEEQDSVRHLRLGHDQRYDRASAELAECGDTVMAVRCPVAPIIGPDGDHRIKKSPESVDRARQLLYVGFGEVTLVCRGFALGRRKRGEYLPVAAERVAV